MRYPTIFECHFLCSTPPIAQLPALIEPVGDQTRAIPGPDGHQILNQRHTHNDTIAHDNILWHNLSTDLCFQWSAVKHTSEWTRLKSVFHALSPLPFGGRKPPLQLFLGPFASTLMTHGPWTPKERPRERHWPLDDAEGKPTCLLLKSTAITAVRLPCVKASAP